jgi:hypothetical protein
VPQLGQRILASRVTQRARRRLIRAAGSHQVGMVPSRSRR